MNIDSEALDTAAVDRRLSGVVAIDRGDESLYERCYGFAHRALQVPSPGRPGSPWPAAARS